MRNFSCVLFRFSFLGHHNFRFRFLETKTNNSSSHCNFRNENYTVPEMAKPLKPTAIVRHAMAVDVSFVNPTPRRNNASRPKPATRAPHGPHHVQLVFLPHDVILAPYMLSSSVSPSDRPSVYHKRILYRNDRAGRVGFCHSHKPYSNNKVLALHCWSGYCTVWQGAS